MSAPPRVIGCWLLVISSLLFSGLFFNISQVKAEVGECTYGEQCTTSDNRSGERTCKGVLEGSACKYGGGAAEEICTVCQAATPTAAPTTTSIPTPSVIQPSITPTITPNSGDNDISKGWNAVTQTSYTTDNLMCDLLAKAGGYCPYGKVAVRKISSNGEITLKLDQGKPGGGAIGSLTNAIAALYNPPTSTVEYLADVGQGFGIIKPAYAQVGGSGQSIIEPIRGLWQVIRNFTYLLFIIIFLVVGFMIMLRQKINPQTVISLQSALPGLIIGLILVTFSYFISALIIDIAFVGVQVVVQIFTQPGVPNGLWTHAQMQNLANSSNAFDLFRSAAFDRWSQNFQDVSSGTGNTMNSVGSIGGIGLPALLTAIVGGVIGSLFGPVGAATGAGIGFAWGSVNSPIPGIIGLIVPLILVVALMIQFFRLLFQLINAYLALLISTLTSPLVILAASLPGKGGTLGFWWKTILGNALVFPAVFAAFLFAGMILGTKPAQWQVSPPLFGGLNPELLRIIIAYGIILGTPAIPGMVKQALGVKDIQGIPQAALGGIMGGAGAVRTGYGRATASLHAAQEEQRKRDAGTAATSIAGWAGTPGVRRALGRIAQRLPT